MEKEYRDGTEKVLMFSMGKLFEKQTGGIRRFIELYHSLIENNYDVELYSTDDIQTFRNNNIISGKSIEVTKKTWLNVPSINVLLSCKELMTKVKQGKYKWVIVFDVMSAITPCIYSVPNVCLFFRQDMIEYRRRAYLDRKMNPVKLSFLLGLGVLAETICIRNAKLMVSQCECDAINLRKRHPFLKKDLNNKLVIQINNINPSWVVESDTITISENEKIYDIIFLGNFKDSRKGHDLLLQALEQLFDEGYKYNTLILGDGEQLEEYKSKYAHLDNVHFMGKICQPADYIVKSRLMIVPSYADSCPNTVLEALYYKVPVIGSNASGVPEILNDAKWLFELDKESLCNKIREIMCEEKLENILYAQNLRRNELMFDWGKSIIEIMKKNV